MNNGRAAIVNRIGTWIAILGIAAYVFNMGQWVGAADEKFEDAQSVEEKQDKIILDVNTIKVTQTAQTTAIADNKTAIETSRREILNAIERLKE